MKRLLAATFLLMLVAVACPQQRATETEDGESPVPTEEPQENALADWAALDRITSRMGLDDEQKGQIADAVEEDATGDQYLPGTGEVVPMENTDITRVVAFSLELDQAKVDELFNATAFLCSTPADLPGLGEGGLLTWCPSPPAPMPPLKTNVYCGEVNGLFPTSPPDQQSQYEYGVAFHDPDGENFQPAFQGDLFTDAGLAVGAHYLADGPDVFRLRFMGQGQGFAEQQLPYRVLLTHTQDRSTFCGVIPERAIGEEGSYPFRMFSFCGNFQRGAADIYPNEIQEFHEPVSLTLRF